MKTLSFYKNKRQSLLVVLAILFLTIFSFYGCNEITEPTVKNIIHAELDKTQAGSYETTKVIAKGLSVFLKYKNNRKIFRELLNNSKYSENIIESSEFLKDNNFKDIIAPLLSTKEKLSFLEKVANIEFGQYDIYFPNQKWRDNWKPSDNLYIAAVGYRDEKDKSKIMAYDLDGNTIYLSSQEEPSIPTLVVYPSEKNRTGNSLLNTFNQLNKNAVPNVQTNYESFCEKYYIEEDFDDHWWLGSMEIYFKVKWSYVGNSTWSSWQNIDMAYSTYAGYWTTVNKLLVSQPGTFDMQIQVWEEDDSSPDDWVCGEVWDYRVPGNGSPTSVLPNTVTPYQLYYTYYQETSGVEYENFVKITGEFPIPLSVSISGPSILYGSSTTNRKKHEVVITEVGESATGTWTAYATDGVGNYSYAWYYRNSPSGGWSNTGATSQSYTRTISNYIELKCEVTSGTDTEYAIKTVTYVPVGEN